MTTATYDQYLLSDPTESYTFKVGLFFDRLVARVTVRVVVETARLLFLGFYAEFETFLDGIESAEEQSRTESEFKGLWERKLRVAQNTAQLVKQLESLAGVTYKGKDLVNYLVGRDRLGGLKLFVEATGFEQKGEAILAHAKREFLVAYGKRRLSRGQREALLEKHKELSQLLPGTSKSA